MDPAAPWQGGRVKPASRVLGRVLGLAPVGLGIAWLFVGILKISDSAGLAEVIRLHAIVPTWSTFLGWTIPALELLVGLGIITTTPPRRAQLHALMLGAGAVLLVTFAAYLALIPESILKQVGCGCLGRAELVLPDIFTGDHAKARWVAADLAAALVHALLAAAVLMRRAVLPRAGAADAQVVPPPGPRAPTHAHPLPEKKPGACAPGFEKWAGLKV